MSFRHQNPLFVILVITAIAILSTSIFLGQASATTTKCKAIDNILPDPKCTPGDINPKVTQDNLKDTICKSGFTKTVRPSVSVTSKIKKIVMKDYGFTDSPLNYELDHLIPLEVGGAPKDVKNLWPEPAYTKVNWHDKDKFENYLNKQVCSGKMSLKDAQNQIATNWYKNWNDAGRPR